MKQILVISLVACVVIAIAVYLYTKEKWTPTYPGSASTPAPNGNTGTLTIDSNGNLSSVASVPLGTIIMRIDTLVPDGWTPCDGRAAVNGITIPDFRGRMPFGSNPGTGVDQNGTPLPNWGPNYSTGEINHQISPPEVPQPVMPNANPPTNVSGYTQGFTFANGAGFALGKVDPLSLLPPILTVNYLIKTS
jgi:hypothetical protein